MEEVFDSTMLQPGWIIELEAIQETSFPEVMLLITDALVPEIYDSLVYGSDLDGCGSFLRACAAYGIVTNNCFHGRNTVPGYQNFIERIRTQLLAAGAAIAEQKLTTPTEPFPRPRQLIMISPKGVEHRKEIKYGESSYPWILELDDLPPRSLILEIGSIPSLGHIRTIDNSILSYWLRLEHMFALACSTTGRYNPVGLGVEELWRSQRYFPLIGSLTGPTDEVENGLSWWRITDPQFAPLPATLLDSTH